MSRQFRGWFSRIVVGTGVGVAALMLAANPALAQSGGGSGGSGSGGASSGSGGTTTGGTTSPGQSATEGATQNPGTSGTNQQDSGTEAGSDTQSEAGTQRSQPNEREATGRTGTDRPSQNTGTSSDRTSREATRGTRDTRDARDAFDNAREGTREFMRDSRDSAREAPRDSQRTGRDARETFDNARDNARDAVRDTRDRARDAARDARETTRDARDSAGEATRDATRTTRDRFDDARDATRDTTRNLRGQFDDTRDAARTTRDRFDDTRDTARDTRRSSDRLSDRMDADDRPWQRDDERFRDRDDRFTDRDNERMRDDRFTDRDDRYTDRDSRSSERFSDRDERSSRDSYRSFSARTGRDFDPARVRPADFGLWLNTRGDNLLISDIASSGPIARLGFRENDYIYSVNGTRVTTERDFVRYLFDPSLRDRDVDVVVYRNGRYQTLHVEPRILVEQYTSTYDHHDPLEHFGLVLDDRYPDRIMVWRVLPGTPAYYAGLRRGDVITTFRGQRIAGPQEFVSIVQDVEPGEVELQVNRNRQTRDLSLEIPRSFTAQRTTTFRRSYDDLDNNQNNRIDRQDIRMERREDRRLDDTRINPDVNIRTPGADVNVDTGRGGILRNVLPGRR